jgi:hypothetical protein
MATKPAQVPLLCRGSYFRSRLALISLAGSAIACSDGAVCDQVLGRGIDLVRQCYEAPVALSGLRACRMRTEKGTQAECVAAQDGALFVVTRNTAASLEGSGFRHGAALSAEENASCSRAQRELGFPGGAATCSDADAGR